jgi:preprotein translocase subunit SecG
MVTLFYFLMTLFVLTSIILIMIILIQKGRGGGLSGAFGGGGGNTAFGTKTGDILTWATSIIFGLFMLFAVILNMVANKVGRPQPIMTQTTSSAPQPAPASPATPGAPGAPANPGQ